MKNPMLQPRSRCRGSVVSEGSAKPVAFKKRSAAFGFGRNTAGAVLAIAARPRGTVTGFKRGYHGCTIGGW